MASVTRSRVIPTHPESVREAILDVGPFMRSSGFDNVEVNGEHLLIENSVGLATITLDLRILPTDDAVLRYEQIEGIFESMETSYFVESSPDGTKVTARTEFTLGGIPGTVLDSTIISRQRKRELENQFDYLESL